MHSLKVGDEDGEPRTATQATAGVRPRSRFSSPLDKIRADVFVTAAKIIWYGPHTWLVMKFDAPFGPILVDRVRREVIIVAGIGGSACTQEAITQRSFAL